jgi:hypothetical protein
MARNWNTLVKEGEAAVDKIAKNKWKLGDLALEVAEMGNSRSNNGSTEKLEEYAATIGVEFRTLQHYREVSAAWPLALRRVSEASWSVHRELIVGGVADTARLDELLDAANGTWLTVDAARVKKGKEPTRFPAPPKDTAGKAKLAAALLADPDVADALPEKTTKAVVSQHVDKVLAKRDTPKKREREARKPGPDYYADLAVFMGGSATKVLRCLKDATDAGAVFSDDQAELLEMYARRMHGAAAAVEAHLHGDALSAEAEAFLAEVQ